MTLNNDELNEKMQFIEQKYTSLIHRMGASEEDLEAIEEEMMSAGNNHNQYKVDSHN